MDDNQHSMEGRATWTQVRGLPTPREPSTAWPIHAANAIYGNTCYPTGPFSRATQGFASDGAAERAAGRHTEGGDRPAWGGRAGLPFLPSDV
jgi:hypothetical protein